ncbi:hypothetical protein CI109_100799 [Kwoniella shandongensis]|uniref:Uncharacterized protein n=1 Tax=Kwoniella shandongensis TaxID=1734106 RepID=A0A5M6BXJ7_9TREE|nr:uncharacterized protein CI109_005022 [Kwoniella shandongensis]KAA5526632.1 hypothetical protein CI109_005022 [Kwoniella shandongensis]
MASKKSAPRHSEPVHKSTTRSNASARKSRSSEPVPSTVGNKRKAARFEDDDEGVEEEEEDRMESGKGGTRSRSVKSKKDGRKRLRKAESMDDETASDQDEEEEEEDVQRVKAVEEEAEEEEDEEEEEHVENQSNSQSQSAVIDKVVKSVAAKLKTSRKSNTTTSGSKRKSDGGHSKEVQKLDTMWQDLMSDVEKMKSGDGGSEDRAKTIDDLTSQMEKKIGKAIESTQHAAEKAANRIKNYMALRSPFTDFVNSYQVELVTTLEQNEKLLEKRPNEVQSGINRFVKLQKDKLREGQQRAKVHLDAKEIIRHSRKQLRASILRG